MNLSALYALIKRFEGLRLKPYLCPAGVPTIGYGHTGGVTMQSLAITAKQADDLIVGDAQIYAQAALRLSPTLALDSNKLNAIADFCFNLGTTRYKSSTLKRKIDAGDYDEAVYELFKWVWGGGRRLPGLVLRRSAEAALLRLQSHIE